MAVKQVRTLSEEIPAHYKGLVPLGRGHRAPHGVYVGPPKTARSHRTVQLPRSPAWRWMR
ncbi:hypothetical protein ACFWB2_24640 [Streptomyces virginiae]|uniref:hypothetical protein n=1 Tax=Streptomyces virginiae TaxID=1961 RepID=UPI00368ED4D2